MQYLTLALAIAGLIARSIAMPDPGEVNLETRATPYSWSVTKWDFCRGNNEYDYSFNVQGPKQGTTPGFKASCSGISQGGYRDCTVTSHKGKYTPTVSSNVNIVNGIPRLFVRREYTDSQGCNYFYNGHYDATLDCESTSGRKFSIVPKPSAVC